MGIIHYVKRYKTPEQKLKEIILTFGRTQKMLCYGGAFLLSF